jgi:exopolysaccharide biosynthesis polyprenyl glycosylphosphotransferase
LAWREIERSRDYMESAKALKNDYVMKTKQFIVKTIHFSVTVGLFYLMFLMFRYGTLSGIQDVGFRYNYIVTGGFAILIAFFNQTYNSYLFGYCRIRALAFAQILSQLFTMSIIFFSVSIGWNQWKAPWWFLILFIIYILLDCVFSFFGNWYYFHLNPPRRTLLIYRNNRDRRRFGSITGKPTERLYQIVKEIQFDGTFDEIKPELDGGYEAVFVAGLNSRCRNGILKYCEDMGIRGFFLPHMGDVIMQGAQHIQAFDTPVMMARRKTLRPEYRVIKRLADFLFSLIGLILLSPIFLITAIAIKCYDRGPVFYRQTRLTKDSREFKIIKFRSMCVDAEKDGVARLSTGEKDDRITPIGRIVRKCRLDELPQLFNILMGDMSIVGPRPERPEIAEEYYKHIPDFRLRLQVKAGLTGYAQVYGKYSSDPYEKLEFDLMYINNMGFLTDLELMFATVGILFVDESTKGIEKGTTAIDYEEE